MIKPEKMVDNEILAKQFNYGLDLIGHSFLMNSQEKLFLMGRIMEIVKFEMMNEKVEG